MSYRVKPPTDHLPKRWQPCDIYFIQAGSGAIKIGLTCNVKRRLRLLRTNTPERLSLIMVLHGPRQLERLLHSHFRDLRIRGEWFEPGDALLKFLDDRARYGWSLAEQQRWMDEAAAELVKHEIKEGQDWLRTYRETENRRAFL